MPVSPIACHRAAMPCRNSSGNVASDASSAPSARNPFQVNATDTHRFSKLTVSVTAFADGTFSRMAWSQARPWAGSRNERNSYRPVSAGTRVTRMYWMSSSSSIGNYLGAFCPGPGRYAPPSGSFCKATVNVDPDCVTCLPCTLNVMVAGTTTYPRSPLTSTCRGSARVTK